MGWKWRVALYLVVMPALDRAITSDKFATLDEPMAFALLCGTLLGAKPPSDLNYDFIHLAETCIACAMTLGDGQIDVKSKGGAKIKL